MKRHSVHSRFSYSRRRPTTGTLVYAKHRLGKVLFNNRKTKKIVILKKKKKLVLEFS